MVAKILVVQDVLEDLDMVSDREQSHRDLLKRIGDEKLYQMASQLSDKGYGPFDKCLTVLTAEAGDLKRAEEKLSNLMFEKNSMKRKE